MVILDETPRGPLFRFGAALVHPQVAFIAELEQSSLFAKATGETLSPEAIVRNYAAAGIDAISCQANPTGDIDPEGMPAAGRRAASVPLLYRGAIQDESQLRQAKLLGAQAVTLRCDLLDEKTIARYLEICDELEIDALVEAHDADDIARADQAGARIIGITDRKREHGAVDLTQARALRKSIPWDVIYVAMDGASSAEDVARLARLGADAIILGETFLQTEDKKETLEAFRAAAQAAIDA